MKDNTTLLVWARNEPLNIEKKLLSLSVYARKYVNIDAVIILDAGILSGTKEIIRSNLSEKLLFTENTRGNDKTLLVDVLKALTSENVIFLDINLNLKFHQIQRQIARLHRAKVVLPSRFDKMSKTKFSSKKQETFIRFKNIIGLLLSGLPYPDLCNNNRCFKTKILLPLLLNTKTNLFFWLEVLREARKKGFRIVVCPTHHIEEKVVIKKQSFFKEIMGLYQKK